MIRSVRFTLFLSTAAYSAILSGCASASKPEAMAAAKADYGRRNSETVSLNVTGGAATSSAGASQIANEDFKTAVAASIEKAKLFSQILGVDASDYHLEIMIARLGQPMFGASMTVTLETNWILTRKADKKVLYQKALPSTYTAKMGEAFAGVTRLRLANEGAARTNIEQALAEIAAIDLKAN